MDFTKFRENPKQYISNLAQVTDQTPDLGIKDQLDNVFNSNPELINTIPIVSTMGHLNMTMPGTLVRLRCVLIKNAYSEFIFHRVHHEGRFYTAIISEEAPENCQLPDMQSMVARNVYLFSSVPSFSDWMITEMTPEHEPANPNLNIEEVQKVNTRLMFEEAFQTQVKMLHAISEKPGIVYDVIGFLSEPEPLRVNPLGFDIPEDDFYSTIPVFVGLTSCEVKSLYMPVLNSPEPSLPEIRAQLLNILAAVFEPVQAEILLLWMLGSVKARTPEIIRGLFSLNFFGATPEIANTLTHLFKFLFTSSMSIPMNCNTLNTMPLNPSVENNEFHSTPFSVPLDTRLIIDETGLDVGQFNEIGVHNINILKKIIDEQTVDYLFEKAYYNINVSYPVLVLSKCKSLLETQVCFPIGNVKSANLSLDPTLLILIRKYLENVKNLDYVMSDEDSNFVQEAITSILKADKEIHPIELHILMIINTLNCISLGAPAITKEIWDHSVMIFNALRQHKRQ
ncbi:hypothetical protein TRFO_36955 [Tritrichomonas foetus]|uniref:Mini-chromosome maintenance complex-binding protein n=1 Tax=Tritrichomonas foetus TaxID=1144522 RepID=A0A1J4JES4_9EUKA|nr:hypothetical protein TRFO_36955 [Tritrichomonas foetus]|eukprot:OHS96799.1 hypothetical protein TRFO_36955 [Tritrichomonas foetus]